MGNEIPNRNPTTWANTDAATGPNAFYEPTHNQKLITVGFGGLGRLMISRNASITWGLKQEERGEWRPCEIEIIIPRESNSKQFGG